LDVFRLLFLIDIVLNINVTVYKEDSVTATACVKENSRILSGLERGFDGENALRNVNIKRDKGGLYVMTATENEKVYLDDFYNLLTATAKKAEMTWEELPKKLQDATGQEIRAYYISRRLIASLVLYTVRRFYTSSEYEDIMTPWCFASLCRWLLLEEIVDKINTTNDINNVFGSKLDHVDNPVLIVRYIKESGKTTLREIFQLPEEVFNHDWHFMEIWRKYTISCRETEESLNRVMTELSKYIV